MPVYNVFQLQPSDPTQVVQAFCTNASGEAGGVTFQTLGWSGTVWLGASSPQNISAPNSFVYDLNDSGDAVGTFGADNTPTQHAFLLRSGNLIDLVPPLPQGSNAAGINNAGLVVGSYGIGVGLRGYVYDSVAQTPPLVIDPLPGLDSSAARAVNKNGAVTGISGEFVPSHGFLFVAGALTDLGPVSFVEDINDAGIVCGSAGAAFPANFHAAICDTTKPSPTFTEIPLPPGFIGSHGSAINNKGDVVGTCWTQQSYDSDQNAYIYTGGVSTDLNTLIPANSGWKLQFANDINDNGQIVGIGLFNGQQSGFLLTPVGSINLWEILSRLLEAAGTIIGYQPIDGSGIIIVNGIPIPVGPWGPRVGDNAQRSDILISLALEQLATRIGNVDSQIAIRRAALESVRLQVKVLLDKLREEE